MSAHCDHHHTDHAHAPDLSPAYRRVLWIALVLNLGMFFVEVAAGVQARSASLLGDAVDFLGDGLNYGVSLAVLGAAAAVRSKTALFKAACMLAFGIGILGYSAVQAVQHWQAPSASHLPLAPVMLAIGFLALVVNVGVAAMLYQHRNGDANMQSVWLCSRNDAISNIAVMLAALGIFGTGTPWPDWFVAAIMGVLAITSGSTVWSRARAELANNSVK